MAEQRAKGGGSPTAGETEDRGAPEGLRCDFCGREVSRVRRIALDDDYDRLVTPHIVQYACASCSARKEAQRRRPSG